MKKILLYVLILTIVMTGCSSTSQDKASADYDRAEQKAPDSDYQVEENLVSDHMNDAADTPAQSSGTNPAADRKLIKTLDLTAETLEFDATIQKLEDWVAQYHGYIESSDISGREYSSRHLRSASFTFRIPADDLGAFTGELEDTINILRKSEKISDVTLQYLDLESHKTALREEQSRITELIKEADTLEILLALESKLTEIRYQLESYESQLRSYDNLTSYATIHLSLREVAEITETEELSIGQQMWQGLQESLKRIGAAFMNFIVNFVIILPYLAIIGIVILILAGWFQHCRKRNARKLADKQAHKES